MWEAIIAALGALLTGWQSSEEQARANASNWAIMQQQQQWQHEQAAWTNEQTRRMYNELYSPAAKVSQLKAAGLSPALIYGQGGTGGAATTSAQPGSVSAPVMQPTLQAGMMESVLKILAGINDSKRLANETKKNDAEVTNLEATYENIIANTNNTEAQTRLINNQTRFAELTNRMTEIELKYKDAKELKEWETMSAELTKITQEGNRLMEEVKGLQIDNKYKEELTLKQIEELDERIANLCENTILTHKKALREELARKLDQKQLDNFDKNIQQLEESINTMKADQNLKKEEERGKKLENDWFYMHKYLQFVILALKAIA